MRSQRHWMQLDPENERQKTEIYMKDITASGVIP